MEDILSPIVGKAPCFTCLDGNCKLVLNLHSYQGSVKGPYTGRLLLCLHFSQDVCCFCIMLILLFPVVLASENILDRGTPIRLSSYQVVTDSANFKGSNTTTSEDLD